MTTIAILLSFLLLITALGYPLAVIQRAEEEHERRARDELRRFESEKGWRN